jgi:hypothetical protein
MAIGILLKLTKKIAEIVVAKTRIQPKEKIKEHAFPRCPQLSQDRLAWKAIGGAAVLLI